MNKTVLFVDDEQNLLDGLKRLMRPMRNTWEMNYALGGREALSILEKSCYDVVITDMKMPDIDGAELLKNVRQICPFSVRMVLSGQADENAVSRSLLYSHQYLSKPCLPEHLQKKIFRACESRERLVEKNIKELVAGMCSILTLPKSIEQLKASLGIENPDYIKIAQIVEKDIGLSAKVLQIMNSEYFGKGNNYTSITQAVGHLGVGNMKLIVQLPELFRACDLRTKGLHFAQTTAHGNRVAKTASLIAKLEGLSEEEQQRAYTAGMMHEIGRLILVSEMPEKYQEVIKLIESEKLSHFEAEREIFGSTHTEIGSYLLALWGIHDSIVEAVAFQNEPSKLSGSSSSLLYILHAANALEDELRPFTLDETKIILDEEYMRAVEKWDDVDNWRTQSRVKE